MAVPKQRHTKSRRNRRRSHHALKKQGFSVCPKCGEPILPHNLCSNCGVYSGKEVIDVMAKLDKKERKKSKKKWRLKRRNKDHKNQWIWKSFLKNNLKIFHLWLIVIYQEVLQCNPYMNGILKAWIKIN